MPLFGSQAGNGGQLISFDLIWGRKHLRFIYFSNTFWEFCQSKINAFFLHHFHILSCAYKFPVARPEIALSELHAEVLKIFIKYTILHHVLV